MILGGLVSLVTFVLEQYVSLLPNADADLVSNISSGTEGFRSALETINWFFPVDVALLFISFIFIFQGSIFLFKIIKYIAGMLSFGILK